MLEKLPKLNLLPRSLVVVGEAELGFAQTEAGPRLAVLGPPKSGLFKGLEGECSEHLGQTLLVGPLSPRNAAGLRAQLP
ncbi:MAG: hypothetical protein QHH30_11850, partial [candidate division NC10 bacterium]|nr:hypothetical protein [candidate division NC10 bacterium]